MTSAPSGLMLAAGLLLAIGVMAMLLQGRVLRGTGYAGKEKLLVRGRKAGWRVPKSHAASNEASLYQGGRSCFAGSTRDLRVFMREREQWTWGRRVCPALRAFAPRDVCWQSLSAFDREGADLELIHVDEEVDLRRAINRSRHAPPFAILQHGVSFADVSRERFAEGWRAAVLTASFQDLSADAARHGFVFLPMPWGADSTHFVPTAAGSRLASNATAYAASNASARGYVLLIGHFPDEESLGEVLFAAAHASVRVRHVGDGGDSLCGACAHWSTVLSAAQRVGERAAAKAAEAMPLLCLPDMALGGKAPCAFHTNLGRVSEAALLSELQNARYVAALRKFEGFELAAVEALFSGSRPIVYDLPTYRWYQGHAVFVGSGLSSSDLFLQLSGLLRLPPEPVGAAELAVLHATFSWQELVPALFARVRAELRHKVARLGAAKFEEKEPSSR